jgi:7-carboxy-7-deazaguanine synthase
VTLWVNEIFRSIQGEAHAIGWPTIFVRLAGCNLRCLYCDTSHAWEEGEELDIDSVRMRVRSLGAAKQNHVLITGGEPLLQKEPALELAAALIKEGYETSMETNGSLLANELPEKLIAVIDVKTPGSGMSGVMNHENFRTARRHHDVFKFVIASNADIAWAFGIIEQYHLEYRYDIYFSPAAAGPEAKEIAEAILASGKRVRLNLQLHKLLWGNNARER